MKKIFVLLLAWLALPAASGAPLLLAAAADMGHCTDQLGAAFGTAVPGAQLKVSLGASGNLFAQIKNGAPFEVFMSADMKYPAQLAQEGAADAATLAPYAIGRIALWSTDPRFDLAQGMRVFDDKRLTRVAIANPDFAPYGRAAKTALEYYGLWESVKPKLVIGENIAQTAQFVQTGNAQVGIVSYATVLSPRLKGGGSYYLIPDSATPPIEQGAVITSRGKANPLAPRFMQFLQSAAARQVLTRCGFGLPREHPAAAHG
jgi:molybdate transport system substrate-binding protein